MSPRPLPVPDALSAGYWESAARHVLALAHCTACGSVGHPPSAVCGACGSTDAGWEYRPVDGAGQVRSWTVVRQSFLPGFEDLVPFTLVDVELDAHPGLRLVGRLLGPPQEPLQPGLPVRVAFEDLAPGQAVPAFTPAPTA